MEVRLMRGESGKAHLDCIYGVDGILRACAVAVLCIFARIMGGNGFRSSLDRLYVNGGGIEKEDFRCSVSATGISTVLHRFLMLVLLDNNSRTLKLSSWLISLGISPSIAPKYP